MDVLDNLVMFPPTRAPEVPHRPPPLARALRDMNLGQVGAELRYPGDLATRVLIANIRLLIVNEGFPLPRTPRFVKGTRLTGAQAVNARSVWDADEVRIWIDGDLPPAVAARKAANDSAATRHRLGEQARLIAGRP